MHQSVCTFVYERETCEFCSERTHTLVSMPGNVQGWRPSGPLSGSRLSRAAPAASVRYCSRNRKLEASGVPSPLRVPMVRNSLILI